MERLTVPHKKLEDGRTAMPIVDGRAVKEHAMDIYWRLKEYEDLEDKGLLVKQFFKAGEEVWCLEEDEYSGYLFMAMCRDYVIVASHYAHCLSFESQLIEMSKESYDDYGVTVEIFHKNRVFKTKKEAERALMQLKKYE